SLELFLRGGPPSTALPGLCRGGPAGLAEMLGWSPAAFACALKELEDAGRVVVDWTNRLLFLPHVLDDNLPELPNSVSSWSKAFTDLPLCELQVSIRESVERSLEGLAP